MKIESLDSAKFSTLKPCTLKNIVGGEVTGAGSKLIGYYYIPKPHGPDANGNQNTTEYETVRVSRYRLWDADETTCSCFKNERIVDYY